MDARSPLAALAEAARGALPGPLEGQHTTAEYCNWPAELRNGACWLPVDTAKPPCTAPKNRRGLRLYEEDNRCWLPVLKAARPPTTGEPRAPSGVSSPE